MWNYKLHVLATLLPLIGTQSRSGELRFACRAPRSLVSEGKTENGKENNQQGEEKAEIKDRSVVTIPKCLILVGRCELPENDTLSSWREQTCTH
jgi:hypothetical protein